MGKGLGKGESEQVGFLYVKIYLTRFFYLNINCICTDFKTTLRAVSFLLYVRYKICGEAGLLRMSIVISSPEALVENQYHSGKNAFGSEEERLRQKVPTILNSLHKSGFLNP